MLVAYVSGIGHIVLQLPECTAVFLDIAFITGTYPSTQINHRLVTLTFAGTDVITQFGMPYQIFNRSNLKENITRQFLTVQQNVIMARAIGLGFV